MTTDFSWAEQQLVCAIQSASARIEEAITNVEHVAIETIKGKSDAPKLLKQRDRLLAALKGLIDGLIAYQCCHEACDQTECGFLSRARGAIKECED